MAPNLRTVLWLIAVFVAIAAVMEKRGRDLARHDPRATTGSGEIVLLQASWCGYCKRLKQAFAQANVQYREFDVEDGGDGEKAYESLDGRGVPITVIGQEVVHGYDADRLTDLLAARGYRVEL